MGARIMTTGCAEQSLLEIRRLSVEFLPPHGRGVQALNEASLDVRAGEAHGLVGESASGKTVMALAVLRLLDPQARITNGDILWEGKNVLSMPWSQVYELRGKGIALIFQNASGSLNPALRIETQLGGLLRFRRHMDAATARAEALRLLSTAE